MLSCSGSVHSADYDVQPRPLRSSAAAGSIGLAVFGVLYATGRAVPWPVEERRLEPTAARIGDQLLSRYLLPFEIVSVLLLVVLIGAVLVGKKEVEE